MHVVTQKEIDRIFELREKARELRALLDDHQCPQCEVGPPCAWVQEHKVMLFDVHLKIEKIDRLTGIF